MPKFIKKNSGDSLELETVIGSGGQAELWSVKGNNRVVAKIYHDYVEIPVSTLNRLIEDPITPSSCGHQFANPQDILLDKQSGEIVGYLMSRFDDANDIKCLFLSSSDAIQDYSNRVALNSAKALSDLHNHGYARVDFENTLVRKDGSIVLVDLDSLYFSGNSVSFAKPDYLPPEYLGQSLDSISFVERDDIWGLSVELWKLLRGESNEHPFACKYVGNQTPPPSRVERIKDGYFTWTKNLADFKCPVNSMPIDDLPRELSQLFINCFDIGHSDPKIRPELDDWIHHLEILDTGSDVTLSYKEWECVKKGISPKVATSRTSIQKVSRSHDFNKVASFVCGCLATSFLFWIVNTVYFSEPAKDQSSTSKWESTPQKQTAETFKSSLPQSSKMNELLAETIAKPSHLKLLTSDQRKSTKRFFQLLENQITGRNGNTPSLINKISSLNSK